MLVVCPPLLGLMFFLTLLNRMIRSCIYIVILQMNGQSFDLIPIKMFFLETLCYNGPMMDISSMCGLIRHYQPLICPLVAIIEPFLLSGRHQRVEKRSQSHLLLGSIRVGDGYSRLLILRESLSPPCCTPSKCPHIRTKGP